MAALQLLNQYETALKRSCALGVTIFRQRYSNSTVVLQANKAIYLPLHPSIPYFLVCFYFLYVFMYLCIHVFVYLQVYNHYHFTTVLAPHQQMYIYNKNIRASNHNSNTNNNKTNNNKNR